ncbi:hypothetical protein C7212DRAFT_348383 [Tuber magnatum]|uniref:Galactose oxidase n=1 Tax=Tuber magnatum TaxID=42249 RepID=A0A317SEC7_9PEZI|nr:hypothetical protein C7212DRAFT_348383 [Tuber magnatum]
MVLVRTRFECTTLLTFSKTNDSKTRLDPVLRSLNVSESFQASLAPANYMRTEKVPDSVPGVVDAAFFPTESGFDLILGKWYPYNSTIYGKKGAPTEDKKWQYEIATRKWTDTGIALRNWSQPNSPRRVSSAMTAWIPSLKKGFLFGGVFASINGTSPNMRELGDHNGLITYDQATNMWTNETTPFGAITDGGLVHVTTATDEVLIQLGGSFERSTRVRPFSEINVYSTKKSKWYTQYLSLDAVVPAPRFSFCTAVKSASDGSSHQIYIMGGLEGSTPLNAKGGPTATSVWVLSIPSFEWAQLQVASATSAADPRGRISPKCQAIGEHYIFYYGGRKVVDYYGTLTCDKKGAAAFLFDINTLTWTDNFTPQEGTYEIPPQVTRLIGGDKNGGSPKKGPTNGWSNPDLEIVMTLKTAATNTTHEPASSIDSSKTNVGAIAGGAVAGVAAVALSLLAAMMLHRCHQRRRSQHPPGREKPLSACGGAQGEGGGPTELDGTGVPPAELPSGMYALELEADRG